MVLSAASVKSVGTEALLETLTQSDEFAADAVRKPAANIAEATAI